MDQENKDALLGLISLIAIALFLIGIFPGLGVFGYYKLEPNYASVEVSKITGSVGESILHVENGGIQNIHHRWLWVTRAEKFDTKIHTVRIDYFGEQREGSMDLFHANGLDYEQLPNNVVIGYRLKAENLKEYYINTVKNMAGPGQIYRADKFSILEELIEGGVFKLLAKEELNEETLENELSNALGGDFAEITSVAFTPKITE